MADYLSKATLLELLGIVNATEKLPAQAALDFLAPTIPSASLQQLDGSRMVKQYVDGSGVAESPFAVNLRIKPDDSDARADAAGALMELADALESLAELPVGWRSLRGVSTPTKIEANEDGSEVWRATFLLESDRGARASS